VLALLFLLLEAVLHVLWLLGVLLLFLASGESGGLPSGFPPDLGFYSCIYEGLSCCKLNLSSFNLGGTPVEAPGLPPATVQE